MKKLLVTGGAGFIGSHFIRHILSTYPEYSVINLDKLTYAGNLDNCSDYAGNPKYRFVQGDITDMATVFPLAEEVNVMVHFAAETHVDRSITDPEVFLKTNVIGTHVLLEAVKKFNHARYVQVSTDEVYGDIAEGFFTETSTLKPSSPYAVSKASGDMLCQAYLRTFKTPIIISRCSNNYGTHQFPEKVIPFFISKLKKGEKAPLYGNGSNVRDWLHVTDHCKAIDLILHQGRIGEIYNISANEEHTNFEITQKMFQILGLPNDSYEFITDRLGHDIRYAVDSSKLRNELGWKPQVPFEKGFEETVRWFYDHL